MATRWRGEPSEWKIRLVRLRHKDQSSGKSDDNANITERRGREGSNLVRTKREPLVLLLAIGGIAAFVSTRSPTKCGTHMRKTVTRDHASQISPSANARRGKERKKVIDITTCGLWKEKKCARRDFARRFVLRGGISPIKRHRGEPIGVITHVVDRFPLAGCAFVIRVGERERGEKTTRQRNAGGRRGFHYADGISFRYFVSANSATYRTAERRRWIFIIRAIITHSAHLVADIYGIRNGFSKDIGAACHKRDTSRGLNDKLISCICIRAGKI